MKEHILIIEDEKAIQDVLYDLLTDAGYEVSLASDGLEGLSFFQSQSFALILLDIMMPKIDGYAVCELMRKESDIPIIMLTAMDEEEAQIRAFELQVDDYITKPFSLKLVLMRIEAVLRRIKEKTGNQCAVSRIQQSVKTLAVYSIEQLESVECLKTDSEYINAYTQKLETVAVNAASNTEGALAVYVRFNPEFTPPTSGLF